MARDPVLNRPEPITSEVESVPFTKRMAPADAVAALRAGAYVLVKDFYSSGLLVLAELKHAVRQQCPDETYAGQRASRAMFRELSHRLLLRVRDHRLLVRKAPAIGWLRILYSDTNEFMLPFVQVQGLNSAWQWYQNGISVPVLTEKIHPFYGTYFPTRFEHLELLDGWLTTYRGDRETAIDVGVGSGVITYQLLKHGFAKVRATDSNPNAIHGMKNAIAQKAIASRVELFGGDLFAECDELADLIIFNPPWLPLTAENDGLDRAMFYDDDLFPRFFAEALKRLNPGGRLVVLFSNLAQLTELAETNPIETEIEHGGRFRKELGMESKVNAASRKTRRNPRWRSQERVELWVLKPI